MTFHVIGGGLSGLSAATELAEAGRQVVVHEGGQMLGGRCRSFEDATIGAVVDNGAHIILGGNRQAFRYLDRIGARDRFITLAPAELPFHDMKTGESWSLRPNAGRLPWWIFADDRRAAGTTAIDYLDSAWRLARAGSTTTVAEALGARRLVFERVWRPLTVAALNTQPEAASAQLLAHALNESFARGEVDCRPYVAAHSLARSFIEPAMSWLTARGVEIRSNARLKAIEFDGSRATRLNFGTAQIDLGADDRVILAIQGPAAADMVPGLAAPLEHTAIVNVHYRLPADAALPGGKPMLGLIGTISEWLFLRDGVLTVTISAADHVVDRDGDEIAALVWSEIAGLLGLPAMELPPFRTFKEKRATFAQTPAALALRPGSRSAFSNLLLAGDWTDTGLPACIEGAITSGVRAAVASLSQAA